MNRKFVKENKKVVREFLGGLLTKIVTGKVNRKVQNLIDNDPEIKKSKEKIKNLEKQMLSKVKRLPQNQNYPSKQYSYSQGRYKVRIFNEKFYCLYINYN